MINLDLLVDSTIDFTFKGKLIKVQQPTIKLVRKFASIDGDSDLDKQIEVITEMLNNNSSNIKLTKVDIEDLTPSALKVIVKAITNNIEEVSNNPN